MAIRHLLSLTALIALLTGCGKTATDATPPGKPSQAADAQAIPDTLFVEAIDGTAVGPSAARASVQPGEAVILTGHIAGRAEPLVAGRAMFTLVDTTLAMCTDGCGTPWDLCCETPEAIAAAAATVQVVGADGKPLKLSLAGKLQPGQTVALTGTVRQNDQFSFVVDAERIAVVR